MFFSSTRMTIKVYVIYIYMQFYSIRKQDFFEFTHIYVHNPKTRMRSVLGSSASHFGSSYVR